VRHIHDRRQDHVDTETAKDFLTSTESEPRRLPDQEARRSERRRFHSIQVYGNVTASRATFCSPFQWTANRYANPSYDTMKTLLFLAYAWRMGGGLGPLWVPRRMPNGDTSSPSKIRGQSLSTCVFPSLQPGPSRRQRSQRIRGRDRGQTYSDERACRAVPRARCRCRPARRRQGARDGGRWRRAIDLAVCNSTIRRSSTRIPPSPREQNCRISGCRVWRTASRPGGNSLSNHKDRVAHRICFLQLPRLGPAHPRSTGDQSGNSAPAIAGQDDRAAFSKLSGDAQNIGYIIPTGGELFLRTSRMPLRRQAGDVRRSADPENPALARLPEAGQESRSMVVHHPALGPEYPLKEGTSVSASR